MGAVTAGSPTTMTRVLDGPRAAAVVATVLPDLPAAGASRIAVVLEDLAGDDGHPLGVAVIDLPAGRAGVLAGLTSASQAVTARLLQVGADHLRARGRLRLTASCAADVPAELERFRAAGFRTVRAQDGRADLVLEL
jgi:hypothetical protein